MALKVRSFFAPAAPVENPDQVFLRQLRAEIPAREQALDLLGVLARQLGALALAGGEVDGPDVVVGGHPHVTQDIEIYRDKPIFYSLGNFVFDGFNDEDTRTGWLLRMNLNREGSLDWRLLEAKIDHQGVPRPGRTLSAEHFPNTK